MTMRRFVLGAFLALLPAMPVAAGDWPGWRGPTGNGVAVGKAPVRWSTTTNVAWKVPVPGRGHSSPTVVGNLVVLQTADEQRKVQSVVAFDRRTGRAAWSTVINTGGFPAQINRKNTHASSTVAGDGTRLYAVSLHHDAIHVTALDHGGRIVWKKNVGSFRPREYKNGYAGSPIIYRGTLVVLADCDTTAFLVALDRKTGGEVWRTKRPTRINYASPAIARIAGRDQLFASGCDRVSGFDAATGKRLWSVPATTMATAGTMVWHDNLVFASGGFPKAETVCVRADGSGKIVWRNLQKCYEQSMLVHDGYLYAMNDTGIIFCWRATDGREMWKTRLRGPISASPVLAGGNIYFTNERGTTWVVRATPERYVEVARNQLGDETMATPSICGGRVYTRVTVNRGGSRSEWLYALSDGGSASGTER